MANPSFDEDDEKPLDPAVERVRRRLSRLMLIGGLTLGLGIFAVFAAILYKIVASGNKLPLPVAGELRTVEAGLPAGARLVSTALDGDRMALTYEDEGGSTVVVVDLRSGAVVSRLRVAR